MWLCSGLYARLHVCLRITGGERLLQSRGPPVAGRRLGVSPGLCDCLCLLVLSDLWRLRVGAGLQGCRRILQG